MTKEEKIKIQRQEMTKFMNYFESHQLDFNDDKILSNMQNVIEKLFQLEIEELGYRYSPQNPEEENTFDLRIVNNPDKEFKGKHNDGISLQNGEIVRKKPYVTYNIATLYDGLESADKNSRLLACKTVFKTVFHEIQHHRQVMMTRTGVSSKNAMIYARDFALKRCLGKSWYTTDSKTGNYEQYAIENNANEVGYKQYLEIMGVEDEEIVSLKDIESGKFSISRYKADVNSWDGQTHYYSGGLQERDDVTVPILEDLITKKGITEILKIYPILQKEYNLDGTKKTVEDLIKNMQHETQEISQNTNLSNREMQELIRDGQAMYYELIYRQLKKSTPEQINQMSIQLGKEELKTLLEKIEKYFQSELEDRLGKSATMASAIHKNKDIGFIMPSNDGTIEVKQNGKKVQMSCDEFIKTINPQLLEKKFIIPAGPEKGEMSASRFIEKYCFGNLSQSGMMTLKNGKQLTAKEFVENYMLQMKDLRKDYTPQKYIKDLVQSEDPWVMQKQHCERLNKYYTDKKEFLHNITKKIDNSIKQTENDKLNKQQLKAKMKWIRGFITCYDANETVQQYAFRERDEDNNTLQVLRGIENGEFQGEGLSKIDLNYIDNDSGSNISRAIPKLARLLKAADNITIEGGRNYLEEFVSIPNIDEILLQIKTSKSMKEMYAQAKNNIEDGNVPHHKKTRAELDKEYAQEYLKSGNLSKTTIEDEIKYRTEIIKNTNQRLICAGVKNINEIPKDRIQKASLERVIARQQGKIPSKVVQKNGNFIFIVDTQKNIEKDTSVEPQVNDSAVADYITITDIIDATLKGGTSMQDINGVIQEIRKTQTKDLQQLQEK